MCRYAIERSRQTVNLLPQGKHLGASPSRHTKKIWDGKQYLNYIKVYVPFDTRELKSVESYTNWINFI